MKHKKRKEEETPNAEQEAAAAETEEQAESASAEADAKVQQDAEVEILTPEDIEELKKKAAEADEWKSKCLYTAAELDNFRKRSARERKELIDYSGQNILRDMLDIIDNFERALEADKKESDPKIIVDGIEIIFKQLLKLMEKYNVAAVPAKGEAFNPEVHEAIQQVPVPDTEPGTVIEELQKGYKLRDRVLRASRVVIAAPPEKSPDTTE
jgi:molecular chaperone GrpE